MPNPGQRHTYNGETREWNGQRWEPVHAMTPVSPQEPGTFWGGFTRHLLEKEQPTVKALAGGAALATGAGAPVMAAVPFLSRLLGKGSEMAATGSTSPPSPGELAWDAAEGAVGGYGGNMVSGVGRGLSKVGELTSNTASRGMNALRTLLGGNPRQFAQDILTSKPVTGAIEKLGQQLTPKGITTAGRHVVRGLTPGFEEAAPYISRSRAVAGGTITDEMLAEQAMEDAARQYRNPEWGANVRPEGRIRTTNPEARVSPEPIVEPARRLSRPSPPSPRTGRPGEGNPGFDYQMEPLPSEHPFAQPEKVYPNFMDSASEIDLSRLSPLDRLAQLARQRAVGHASRTKTPLSEKF